MIKLKHGSEGNVISSLVAVRRRTMQLLCAALVVGVAAACESQVEPVFVVPGTGSVEGLLFLDANRDSKYDPSAGDRLLPNVNVSVVERGTTQVLAGATGKTDATGRFLLPSVPVGTHELRIDTTGVGAGVAFCANPIAISVFLNETQFKEVAARGGCIITIAEAEQVGTGKTVTVRGTVTSSPGQIIAGRMYLQDETGGIRVDQLAAAGATIAVGDVIEVAGTYTLNAGESVLTPAKLNERVAGTERTPVLTTTKALADAGPVTADPLNGTFVTVHKAKVTTIWNNGTGSSRNAFINDGTGQALLRIDTGTIFVTGTVADLVARLSEIAGLNKCYDITGIATNFNGLGEVFPRTLSDIKEVSCN